MSIKEEILTTIEDVSKAAAKTSSNKNYGIYLSTISSLANILSVLANLEKESPDKAKIFANNDKKPVEEVEVNRVIDWKSKKETNLKRGKLCIEINLMI